MPGLSSPLSLCLYCSSCQGRHSQILALPGSSCLHQLHSREGAIGHISAPISIALLSFSFSVAFISFRYFTGLLFFDALWSQTQGVEQGPFCYWHNPKCLEPCLQREEHLINICWKSEWENESSTWSTSQGKVNENHVYKLLQISSTNTMKIRQICIGYLCQWAWSESCLGGRVRSLLSSAGVSSNNWDAR